MPPFAPPSVDMSIYCLCECLGSIYITSICLLYWLEGRKSSNFLKILINLQLWAWIPEVIS